VTPDGEISPFAIFPPRKNTTGIGPPIFQQVPTGTTIGPDDALYITTLTGFPFPTGEAVVYRIPEARAAEVYASGFTTATDLAFDSDGSLIVTEFSTDIANQAPGRLVRWTDGEITVVQDGLISPTSVVLRDGIVFVSQEFAGLVNIIAPAPPADEAATDETQAEEEAAPAAEEEAAAEDVAEEAQEEEAAVTEPVVLPTTGSGGLADINDGGLGPLAVVAIAAATSLFAVLAMSLGRRRTL
jgi:hypothetical protein